LVFFFLLCICK